MEIGAGRSRGKTAAIVAGLGLLSILAGNRLLAASRLDQPVAGDATPDAAHHVEPDIGPATFVVTGVALHPGPAAAALAAAITPAAGRTAIRVVPLPPAATPAATPGPTRPPTRGREGRWPLP